MGKPRKKLNAKDAKSAKSKGLAGQASSADGGNGSLHPTKKNQPIAATAHASPSQQSAEVVPQKDLSKQSQSARLDDKGVTGKVSCPGDDSAGSPHTHAGKPERAVDTKARQSKTTKTLAPVTAPAPGQPGNPMAKPLLGFRKYQEDAFWSENRIEVWLWARQVGKSRTLAAWSIDRLLQFPGRLVTILSNTKDNGIEVNMRVAEICELLGQAFEQEDLSTDAKYENMRLETRIKIGGKVGRIKVLAASPRTARGFSGDLILDEFAFHENSRAIWDAAEPIISSNPDFLCRIASTPNGRHNMFYQFCTDGIFPVRKVTRTLANQQGAKIYHPVKRGVEITPAEARALAADKRSYDQNYELIFADENMALLTYELIGMAERDGVGELCEQQWSAAAIARMLNAIGPLYAGVDVGRHVDKSVVTVLEKVEGVFKLRAQLVMTEMRLPDQQKRLETVLALKLLKKMCIDMTGLGLGLFEYTQQKMGSRVAGINFGTSVPATNRLKVEGKKQETVPVTEAMATELLGTFEDRRIHIPVSPELREDLRKPERITTPGGRVSIAATRTEAGHADRFWSVALAVEAGASGDMEFVYAPIGNSTAEFDDEADGGSRVIKRGKGCIG